MELQLKHQHSSQLKSYSEIQVDKHPPPRKKKCFWCKISFIRTQDGSPRRSNSYRSSTNIDENYSATAHSIVRSPNLFKQINPRLLDHLYHTFFILGNNSHPIEIKKKNAVAVWRTHRETRVSGERRRDRVRRGKRRRRCRGSTAASIFVRSAALGDIATARRRACERPLAHNPRHFTEGARIENQKKKWRIPEIVGIRV